MVLTPLKFNNPLELFLMTLDWPGIKSKPRFFKVSNPLLSMILFVEFENVFNERPSIETCLPAGILIIKGRST